MASDEQAANKANPTAAEKTLPGTRENNTLQMALNTVRTYLLLFQLITKSIFHITLSGAKLILVVIDTAVDVLWDSSPAKTKSTF